MYAINPELCTFCKKWAKNVPGGAITEGPRMARKFAL